MTRHDILLGGCTAEPLSSYLTGLGIVQVVGEQVDAQASARWSADGLILHSTLDADGIVAFFRDTYRPSPIMSPWNRDSGLMGGKKAVANGVMKIVEESESPRFAAYRETLTSARAIGEAAGQHGWDKGRVVEECRARFPEPALKWLDAAVAVGSAHELLPMPPLLGSGGNDGRLEFSVTFMSLLIAALGPVLLPEVPAKTAGETRRRAQAALQRGSWLQEALFGICPETGSVPPAPLFLNRSGGFFHPGRLGGANGSSEGGAGEALVNPWSFVLTMEGALLFASAAARRLGQRRGGAGAPFTVTATSAGYTSAAEEASRGEIWCPLWEQPASVAEITRLLGEGRAQWRGQQARTGVDFARAAVSKGVDPGVSHFSRYALLARNGLAVLAVPIGLSSTAERPAVRLTAQLDPWLSKVRSVKNAAPPLSQALLQMDNALFALTQRDDAEQVLRVLVAASKLEWEVSQSRGAREQVPPVSGLRGQDWMPALGLSRSSELRVAAVLASGRDYAVPNHDQMSMRMILRPVTARSAPYGATRFWQWRPQPLVPGLRTTPLLPLLAEVLAWRCRQSPQHPFPSQLPRVGATSYIPGAMPAFAKGLRANLADVESLLNGRLDLRRVTEVLEALLLLDWDMVAPEVIGGELGSAETLPAAAALVLPWFYGRKSLWRPEVSGELARYRLAADPRWGQLLAAGRTDDVARGALQRAYAAGLSPVWVAGESGEPSPSGMGPALAAACLLRLGEPAVGALLDRVRALSHPALAGTQAM